MKDRIAAWLRPIVFLGQNRITLAGATITLVGTAAFAIAYLASDVTRRRSLARVEGHAAI